MARSVAGRGGRCLLRAIVQLFLFFSKDLSISASLWQQTAWVELTRFDLEGISHVKYNMDHSNGATSVVVLIKCFERQVARLDFALLLTLTRMISRTGWFTRSLHEEGRFVYSIYSQTLSSRDLLE